MEEFYLSRLQQSHAGWLWHLFPLVHLSLSSVLKGHEDTYQSYSSFTTRFKPAAEYEPLLVSSSGLAYEVVRHLCRVREFGGLSIGGGGGGRDGWKSLSKYGRKVYIGGTQEGEVTEGVAEREGF